MSYFEVLKLPVKTFWSLNRQINRLRAESDLRTLRVYGGAQSAEGAKLVSTSLIEEMGKPMHAVKSFDEEKFLELQAKFMRG